MSQPPALWADTYPTMRHILNAVIAANRGAARPVVDVRQLERVRRDLGRLDRGTYRPCTYSPPAFSAPAAYSLVRHVLDATSIGHPQAGAIHRLAADLADQLAAPPAA